MAHRLIINTTSEEQRIALLEYDKIVEYHKAKKNHTYNVGDVYLGTVKRILENLNAVFVGLGHEKDGFLHYLDLGENFQTSQKFVRKVRLQKNAKHDLTKIPLEKTLTKEGNISQVLKKNEKILVQITKEAISTKGLRLSSSITIPGRYLILIPFGNDVNVSQKITNRSERDRIKKLILAIKPKNFAVIARTNAQSKEAAVLDQDLKDLYKKWLQGVKVLANAKAKEKIIKEVSRISSILRDLLSESFDQIIVDDEKTYEQVKEEVSRIYPGKEKIVHLYKGKTNLFEHLDLERKIQSAFSQIVNLENGAYLKVEQTEAMVTIDINSGSYTNTKSNQDDNFQINLVAIRKIFPLLRLLNIGGMIIVDCISMKDSKNQDILYQEAKRLAREDTAKIKVLPLTEFGLMQITRERTRPIAHLVSQEICPTCRGSKTIQNSLVISLQIEKMLHFLIKKQKQRKITLVLHPYLHAYFTKGMLSKQWHWYLRYFQWIKLVPNQTIPITTYQFLNEKKKLIASNPTVTLSKINEHIP